MASHGVGYCADMADTPVDHTRRIAKAMEAAADRALAIAADTDHAETVVGMYRVAQDLYRGCAEVWYRVAELEARGVPESVDQQSARAVTVPARDRRCGACGHHAFYHGGRGCSVTSGGVACGCGGTAKVAAAAG